MVLVMEMERSGEWRSACMQAGGVAKRQK